MSRQKPHSWQFSKVETAKYKAHGYDTKVKVCKVCKCKSLTTAIAFAFKTSYILRGERYELSPDCK